MFNKLLKNSRNAEERRAVLRLLTLVVFLLLAACASPASQPEAATEPTAAPTEEVAEAEPSPAVEEEAEASEPGAGDTLRLLYWQAPTIVNPHLSPGVKDQQASRIAYEPLASFDAEGNMVPFLAAEIPSLENGGVAADGKSVTWKLKEGVKWADGEPFTAADVLFTYEYLSNPDVGASTVSEYEMVDSVEVVDDTTVKVNFKDVNPAWALPFVGVKGMILPRHIFQDYNGPNFQDAPANLKAIGTGPYYVTEFRTEDILLIGEDAVSTIKIVYEPNPHYREPDKPYFSRVELQGGGDATVAAQAVLQEGLVDFAWNLQTDEETLKSLEAGGVGRMVVYPSAFVERIMLNFTDPNRETADGERSSLQIPHPFLTDLQVRQAINLAIDRQAIAQLYGRGGRLTTNLLVSPANYDSPNTKPEFDLDKAAALLDEAGWTDSDGDGTRDKEGVKLSLLYQTSVNPLRQQVQEIVKGALEKIGFEVELKFIDASIFFSSGPENTNTRSHFYADLEEFATSNKSPDPTSYMNWWTCDQASQKANNWSLPNLGRYCNSAFDALHRQVSTELDPEKRRQLFIQLNDLLIDDVAVIPLIQINEIPAINNTLVGFEPTPWDSEVWNIKDWRRE